MAVDRVLVAVNLTGSLLSILGTSFILISYLVLPQKRHIRHALITNLTIADFLNALNNSASGLYVALSGKPLTASSACTANGFAGQLTVQAVDFSILIITVLTCWIVTSAKSTTDFSLLQIALVCASAWVVPIITSITALQLEVYGPASSNWCWIQAKPVYLRYVLTHGWRFVIIAIVIALCIYIQLYLRRHSQKLNHYSRSTGSQAYGRSRRLNRWKITRGGSAMLMDSEPAYPSEHSEDMLFFIQEDGRNAVPAFIDQGPPSPPQKPRKDSFFEQCLFGVRKTNPQVTGLQPEVPKTQSRGATRNTVQKAMLLHAYPIAYVILWIPGISMRIVDATGGTSYALAVLQASTQFIGFANALTFGWTEGIGKQLGNKFKKIPNS